MKTTIAHSEFCFYGRCDTGVGEISNAFLFLTEIVNFFCETVEKCRKMWYNFNNIRARHCEVQEELC